MNKCPTCNQNIPDYSCHRCGKYIGRYGLCKVCEIEFFYEMLEPIKHSVAELESMQQTCTAISNKISKHFMKEIFNVS